MDAEPPMLAVQRCAPSNAMPEEPPPRFDATVVTAPAGALGSIRYSLPGDTFSETKTPPIATRTSRGLLAAPVQVPRELPLAARRRVTVASVLATHKSRPSNRTWTGAEPMVTPTLSKLIGAN